MGKSRLTSNLLFYRHLIAENFACHPRPECRKNTPTSGPSNVTPWQTSFLANSKRQSTHSGDLILTECIFSSLYLKHFLHLRIIDVRYNFEYKGGHIAGAENWQHGEDEEFLSHFVPAEPLDSAPSPGGVKDEKRNIVIFHCEFSSERAPDFYKKLRERDRNVNEHVYPALHYPEIYLLHLGYKEFYNHYPDLCEGGYMEMSDPRYNNELRKMRAKSKSWSGGTVARTGAMARRLGGFV